MCGIVGIVHRDPGIPVSRAIIERMCDAIRHRGPDDLGVFVNGRVGLGMRRLSIIDLDGSRQPLTNEDGSKTLVFNGEIYNYRELRKELLSRGHTLRTGGDTETIVHLYEDFDRKCADPLRGMFAFAVWDEEKKKLVLARDRVGIKPLYAVVRQWGIAFASELKALHAVGLTGSDLDWSALGAYFQLGYIPAPTTPFLNVEKIEPGHVLEWTPERGASRHQYWDLPQETLSPAHAEQLVREELDEAVAAHMVSDVPVAAFLSGGIDSSAVVSSMALAGQPPHAFTARYGGTTADRTDESKLAKQLSDRYGAKLTVVDVEPEIGAIFEPIVRALDEPHADESSIPSWLISERVAAEYKVALVGTGGDELFGGYRRHLGLLASGVFGLIPSPLRQAASSITHMLPEPSSGSLMLHRFKRFLRMPGGSVADRYVSLLDKSPNGNRLAVFDPALAGELSESAAKARFEELLEVCGGLRGLRTALYFDYKTYLPDDLLHLADRVSMAHSLELRVPFVDHKLIEAVFPFPDRTRIGFGKAKHLLRRALRDRLPEAHFNAPKRGFVGPTAEWLRGELRSMLTDELSEERVTRLHYFDPAIVARLLDEHFRRRHNHESVLWGLLVFSTWHRHYVEEHTAVPYSELQAVGGA